MGRWEKGSGGALVALAAAMGLVVGVRSVAGLEWVGVRPLVGLELLPRVGLGVAWSPDAVWPAQLQAAAVERAVALLGTLFLAAVSVALVNALTLLLEAGAARWRSVAVRAALGASPARLVGELLREVRRLLLTATVFGLLLGLAGAGALRLSWPGTLLAPEPGRGLATVLAALVVLTLAAAAAYVAVGFRTLRRGALATALATGDRTSPDRGAAFLRRLLATAQGGAAGAAVLGSLAVAGVVATAGTPATGGPEARVVPVSAPASAGPGHWTGLLDRVAQLPGVEAESLATPGALVGLGVRDVAMAECGMCVVGGIPLPYRFARADHHAVTPGWVGTAGIRLVEGRGLAVEPADGDPAEALVNETFAAGYFENGAPVGKRIRVGTGLDRWYTVVGVVEDASFPVLGGDDRRRPALYVNALGDEPAHGDLLFRGDEETGRAVEALLSATGYRAGAPRTLAAHRRASAAPLGWTGRVALGLGALTLLLAVHGAHLTALQVTRRRTRELAVRRALGASDRRLLAYVLRGAAGQGLGSALVALFFGSLLAALVRKVAAGVPALGPLPYLAVAALLVGVGVLGAGRAALEALRVAPRRALAGEGPPPSEPRRGASG